MLLRKLGKRGTAIIEYVILLSFVAVIGTSFTSDSGMGGSIKSIITNVEQLLGLAAGKSPYRYKVNIDPDYKQYEDFANELINKVYDEMQKYTDEDHPIDQVRIKNGQITFYGWLGDPNNNNKGGGTKTLETPIPISSLLSSNSKYTTTGDSLLIFDRSGNIVNYDSKNVNKITRIYIANSKDPNKKIDELTFKQSNQTFSGINGYWKE